MSQARFDSSIGFYNLSIAPYEDISQNPRELSDLDVFALFLSLVALTVPMPLACEHAFADISGYNVQEWVDKERGVKIQFAYDPELPIIDEFTDLRFSVQDPDNGEHLHGFKPRVVVSTIGGERLFRFEDIQVSGGHFSVKYNFPDDGTHAVLLRLDNESNGELISTASFSVFVPHQSPPSILDLFPKKPGQTEDDMSVVLSKIAMIVLPAAAVASIIIVLKKTRPKR